MNTKIASMYALHLAKLVYPNPTNLPASKNVGKMHKVPAYVFHANPDALQWNNEEETSDATLSQAIYDWSSRLICILTLKAFHEFKLEFYFTSII